MRRARHLVFALWMGAVACASSKPPPPVIETQPADIGPSARKSEPESEPDTASVGEPTNVGEPSAPKLGVGGQASVTAEAGQPEITVLDAGKEPRKVLRHTFKKGAHQKLAMHSTTQISGAAMPLPSFALDAPIVAKITEVNAAGDAKFSYTAGPFKTKAQGGGALTSLLGGIGGGSAPEKVAGWGWITPQGVVREQHVTEGMKDGDAPVETGDPFPAEAIGVGARWEVKSVITEKGTKYRQTSSYDLVQLVRGVVKTKVSRVQEPLAGADGPVAESSGELAYKLGQIYPTGRLSMTRAVDVAIPGAEQLGLKMSSEVTIKGK